MTMSTRARIWEFK